MRYFGSETVVRISPAKAEIIVEQEEKGVITRKNITPEKLAESILRSRKDQALIKSGILPENCISVTLLGNSTTYFIRYPLLRATITYYGTVYEDFPLPRLLFAFQRNSASGKILDARLCVVRDERLTEETPTYFYPFSNVFSNSRICLGNNALPIYKDPGRVCTLADLILRFPNNNDMFHSDHNRLHMEYRELLEHLKDKDPAYYYTDVLIPNGKTIKDFMMGGN